MNTHTSTGTFDPLLGGKLASVTFIWNYYQVVIGVAGLSFFSDPAVLQGNRWLRHEDTGFRDALCSLIGQAVVDVHDNEDGMTIFFANSHRIHVSFRSEDRIGGAPEALDMSVDGVPLVVVGDQ